MNLTVGVFASYFLAGFLSWRNSALVSIIPSLLFFVGLCLVPETPYWYLLKGDHEAAIASLKTLRGSKHDCESEIKQMAKKLSDVGTISYLELFKKRTLLPLLVALFIQTLQQVCGGNVIMMYTSTIFTASNSSINAEEATIYTGLAQIVGNMISLSLIDHLGRRILLFASVFFAGIFMSIFGVYFLFLGTDSEWKTSTPLIICIGIVMSYTLGCRSIPWLIGGEIFNTSVRSRANSVIVVYNRLLNLIAVQVRHKNIYYIIHQHMYYRYRTTIYVLQVRLLQIHYLTITFMNLICLLKVKITQRNKTLIHTRQNYCTKNVLFSQVHFPI